MWRCWNTHEFEVEVGERCENLGTTLKGIRYITQKQMGGDYSFMKNENFKVNSRKDTWKKEVEAWMGGKGGDGDYSKIVFNEKGHSRLKGGGE